ncbi:MAG: LAGLIDADG family homing endonuclease [Candidatus Colwellbacteria bacterium]|nr:LAGLIDADG family homing endonuclease [Candidatus Colwellbacteria bacterium]
MSENAFGADNQQATPLSGGASETTRQAPFTKKEILAYLNGAIHDATLNKGKRIRFAQKEKRWLEILRQLFKTLKYNSWIYKEGRERNVYVLETLCPELDFHFDPSKCSAREKLAYIRGFFDAEGGIPHNGKRFYIQLVQKNFEKVFLLKQLLQDVGIKSGKIHNPSKQIDPHYWRIFVLTKSQKKFAEKIGSYHPIKAEIFHERMKI